MDILDWIFTMKFRLELWLESYVNKPRVISQETQRRRTLAQRNEIEHVNKQRQTKKFLSHGGSCSDER